MSRSEGGGGDPCDASPRERDDSINDDERTPPHAAGMDVTGDWGDWGDLTNADPRPPYPLLGPAPMSAPSEKETDGAWGSLFRPFRPYAGTERDAAAAKPRAFSRSAAVSRSCAS